MFFRPLIGVLLPALTACGAESSIYAPLKLSYDRVVEDCSHEAVVPGRSPLTPAGGFWGVDATCSETVGTAFHLDWDSFGEEPPTFTDATTPAELIVGGFLVVLGFNGVPISTTTRAGTPDGLLEELTRLQDLAGITDTEDAGRLWFEVLSAHVDEVHYSPEIDATMSYSGGRVRIGDITNEVTGNIGFGDPLPAVEVAADLVHEAAHGYLGGHTSTPDDVDPNGAFGAQTWWLYDWLAANGPRLEGETRADAELALMFACWGIDDVEGYEACND